MNKEKLLNKLSDLIHSFEEKSIEDFYPPYLQLIETSNLAEDSKVSCREIFKKIVDESKIHIRILGELKETVTKSDKYDF